MNEQWQSMRSNENLWNSDRNRWNNNENPWNSYAHIVNYNRNSAIQPRQTNRTQTASEWTTVSWLFFCDYAELQPDCARLQSCWVYAHLVSLLTIESESSDLSSQPRIGWKGTGLHMIPQLSFWCAGELQLHRRNSYTIDTRHSAKTQAVDKIWIRMQQQSHSSDSQSLQNSSDSEIYAFRRATVTQLSYVR